MGREADRRSETEPPAWFISYATETAREMAQNTAAVKALGDTFAEFKTALTRLSERWDKERGAANDDSRSRTRWMVGIGVAFVVPTVLGIGALFVAISQIGWLNQEVRELKPTKELATRLDERTMTDGDDIKVLFDRAYELQRRVSRMEGD